MATFLCFIEILELARSCHRITLLELAQISSTSHSNLSWGRDSHDLLRQQSENLVFKVENLMNYEVFGSFFSILSFSQFWIVFGRSDSQFRLRGVISCPGWPQITLGLKFHSK